MRGAPLAVHAVTLQLLSYTFCKHVTKTFGQREGSSASERDGSLVSAVQAPCVRVQRPLADNLSPHSLLFAVDLMSETVLPILRLSACLTVSFACACSSADQMILLQCMPLPLMTGLHTFLLYQSSITSTKAFDIRKKLNKAL